MPDLIDAARSGRLVLFVGAGVSMIPPTQLPSWRDVNRLVIDSLAAKAATLVGGEMADAAAGMLKNRHEQERLPPEYQAQVLADTLDERYFEVLRHLDSDRPNAAHLTIASLARLGCVRAVITTNFDRTLEAAFRAVGAPIECHFRSAHFQDLAGDLERFARADTPCQLLKLHGSAEDPGSLVDTLAQRKRGFPVPVTECVRHLLHFGPWLFLGFSGLDLEAEPNYLSLAQESERAAGFTWLVRQGTQPRAPVLRLQQLYGDRAEVVFGDLPDWLLKLSEGISPDMRPGVAALVSRVPAAAHDAAAALERDVKAWGAGISSHACALSLAHLVIASSEPQRAADLLEKVLSALEQRYDPKAQSDSRYKYSRAAAMNSLGMVLAGMGRHEEAVGWFKSSVDLAREIGDEEAHDDFASNLAASIESLGDTNTARDLYQAALAGFRSRGDPRRIAQALGSLTQHLIRQGELTEARPLAVEALEQARLAGDEPLRAVGLVNLGMICRMQQEYATALAHFTECETICRRLGHDEGVAAALGNRADTRVAMGDDAEAEALYKAALALNERIGRRENQGETLMSLGHLARARKDLTDAERYCTEALAIYREMKNPSQESMALYHLASLAAEAGRFQEALALAQTALPLVAERNRSFKAQVLSAIGLICLKQGYVVKAEAAYRDAYAIAAALGTSYLRAVCAQNLGTTTMLQVRDDEAARFFEEAAGLWDRLGRAEDAEHARLGRSAVLLDRKLAAMSSAAHELSDLAQQQAAAREMTAFYPTLVEMYKKLGADERAAHSLFSAATIWQFVGQAARAVEAYRQVAGEYGELGKTADRKEALERCEKLLQRRTDAFLREGPSEQAVPWLLRLAEVAGELGHVDVFTGAALDAAMTILHTGGEAAKARQLADVAYAQLDPDSEKARHAHAIMRMCDDLLRTA